MAQKKSYSRYFIILQEDEKGYSISSDKVASGYAKLELKNDKCKISYYVQNLKKESAPYYMLLICNKKDIRKVIKISQINIDDYGRADICHEYLADNIAGTGISMDKISGAAIVKFLDSNIIPVMSGFASTEIPDWKTFVMVDLKVEKEKVANTPNSMFDKYEENIESLKGENKTKQIENVKILPKEDNSKKEQYINKENNFNKNIIKEEANAAKKNNVKEEIKVTKKDNTKEKVDIIKKDNAKVEGNINKKINISDKNNINNKENVNKKYDMEKDNYGKGEREYTLKKQSKKDANINPKVDENYPQMDENGFFRNLVQGFEFMGEISSEIKRCKWYKIPVTSPKSMYDMSDYNRYSMIYYPMMNYYQYIIKQKHYIIGYKLNKDGEMKYLVYGIAGTKSKMDQPYGGRSGFVTWMPLNVDDEREEAMGYWLMFYDFKTSTIMIPVKK